MTKASPLSIFAAATTLLMASSNMAPSLAQADADGGLKEWTTDQAIDAESTMDDDAAALMKKAKLEDVCIPIGEGENCW